MGYSGYSQFWCKNGHYWTVDCEALPNLQYEDNVKQKCPICNEPEVFENMVNVTNGSFDDDGTRIDGFIEPEIIKEVTLICKCGNEHLCSCSIYKIPKKT